MSRNTRILILLFVLISSLAKAGDIDTLVMRYNQYDSIFLVDLPEVVIFPRPVFKTKKERNYYYTLVNDVKKTLPFAKKAGEVLRDVDEHLQTISSKKKKDEYIKSVEKELFKDFEKDLRKLNYRQGKLLIKLVDRECNQTSYEIVKLYRGKFSAFFWQTVAVIFKTNLKENYNPEGDDKLLEQVVVMVEKGWL